MFNPAQAAANIKEEFIDYIATIHTFADKELQKQLVCELQKNIAQGPLLEMKDVFKSGKSIEELISDTECLLSPLFRELEANKPNGKLYKHKLPLDRKLYLHQEKAIKAIVGGNNVVVSTGTGSGKTNCFLIPVLNELLKEKEQGTLNKGVRALFIYPMNALANDQMKNIREILMYYPDITFGVYNGGTENEEEQAIAVYEAMFANEKIHELQHRLPNEKLSRDEMKQSPPNILFTNYAMLEHLLLRPKDDVLFSDADFRFVVLDEAHIYTGATGIETAILLRRLKARISATKETQFILTSATLGYDNSVDDDIVTFAENLCGVSFDKRNIIRAEREEYVQAKTIKNYPVELYEKLADKKRYVWQTLNEYGIKADKEKDEKELLYEFLACSDLYNELRMLTKEVYDLSEIREKLRVPIDVVTAFISLCIRAQKNGKSLIDARYHFFIRSLEGCYITLRADKKLFLNRQRVYKNNSEETAVFEVAVCSDCGRIALVGKLKNGKLEQTSKLEEEVEYFYFDKDDNQEEVDEEETNAKQEKFFLCKKCGSMIAENDTVHRHCDCGANDFIKVVKGKILSNGARCGNCHVGRYQRMYLGNDAATSVLATALYEELPESEYTEETANQSRTTNIFGQIALQNKKERKKGRQFLVFSDSRQEAAKFACYLGKSYDEFLRRRGICRIIEEKRESLAANAIAISEFVTLLNNLFTTRKSFAKSNSDASNSTEESRKNAWVAMLNELVRYNSPTSLTSLGQIQFEYRGNTPEIIETVAQRYKVDASSVKALLDMLIFEIVKMGAICADSDSDIDDNDREYIFYSPVQRFVSLTTPATGEKPFVKNWLPKARGDGFFSSNRMRYVCEVLKVSEKEANEFLRQYFEYLAKPEIGNQYCMEDLNKDGTYVIRAKNFRVKIKGSPETHWYRCKKCGRVTQFNLGYCPSAKCKGEVEEIDPGEIARENHYVKLYLSDRMAPLLIKEHTAQLSKKESAEYQELFIRKEINALSCSTTFEMGVDVGDLEAVFMRDVPPLPSNYAQRAGRAGRSLDAAAFVLTYAKLSSHDLAFFKAPKQMIKGTILPPLFKVDNEKIARRHIYAVALSMYFAQHEDQYNHNDAHKFINDKGYKGFIEWINSSPADLLQMLKRSIPNINEFHKRLGIDDFSWIEEFSGEEGVFTQLIQEYESNVQNFCKLIEQFKKDNDFQKANDCENKRRHYTTNKLIDFLARGNILPRYGFPVNTVELQQNSTARNVPKLRLSRDLQIAIAEYAPSSEVVADGRLYTSRYIKKTAIGKDRKEWYTGYIGVCYNNNCNTVNYSITPISQEGIKCSACGAKLTEIDFNESIEPRSGFVAERKDRDVPMTRQEKNYRSEDYYIGNVAAKTIEKHKYLFNAIEVIVESTTNDSLLVKSVNSFYVCPICGYAIAEDENIGDKTIEKQMKEGALSVTISKPHESLYGQYKCKGVTLERRSLHHEFKTDVAKISFECDTSDYNTMVSVLYALLNAMSKDLNIERRDIKACLSKEIIDGVLKFSIIIYDAVPGGAGHSRRLVTEDGKMLHNVFMSALHAMESCNCDPSCYNCLRSYENQKIHDKLDRKLAIAFLQQFDGAVERVDDAIETNSH